MVVLNAKILRSSLYRKIVSAITGMDPSTQTQPIDIPPNMVAVVADKKFPLHAIIDDPNGYGSNTGGVIIVGDATNPDDNYTRTIINSAYSASPSAGTDTQVRATTSGKTFYCTQIVYLKITSELVTIKDGSGGTVKMYFKPSANTPSTQNMTAAPLVFATGVYTNQATSESTQILLAGYEQ